MAAGGIQPPGGAARRDEPLAGVGGQPARPAGSSLAWLSAMVMQAPDMKPLTTEDPRKWVIHPMRRTPTAV